MTMNFSHDQECVCAKCDEARAVRYEEIATDPQTVVIPLHGGNDPDGENDRRAALGDAVLHWFQDETNSDDCDALSDLLCDLMHISADSPNKYGDFASELRRAAMHFEAETGEG